MDQKDIFRKSGLTRLLTSVIHMVGLAAVFGMILFVNMGVQEGHAGETEVIVKETRIYGTVGVPLKVQELILKVTNGKFDTDLLYEGRDISSFFIFFPPDRIPEKAYGYGITGEPQIYYMPYGLKVVITSSDETTLRCKVSGTPYSPLMGTIRLYMDASLFSESSFDENTGVVEFFHSHNYEDAQWCVTSKDDKYLKATMTMTPDKTPLDLSGKAGQTQFDLGFTINLAYACFKTDMAAGTDVSSWFSGSLIRDNGAVDNQLPVGLSVTLVSDVHAGDTSCKIRLSGTPEYSSHNIFAASIPYGYIIGAPTDTWIWEDLDETLVAEIEGAVFNIEPDGEEPPYILFRRNDLIVCSAKVYNRNMIQIPRLYFRIYNGNFAEDPSVGDTKPWNVDLEAYRYSNVEGNFDLEAPGFLYSPTVNDPTHGYNEPLYFTDVKPTEESFSAESSSYVAGLGGVPLVCGEYDLSYFIPLSYLSGHEGEEGYTKVVTNGAKLIVVSRVRLDPEDVEINVMKGQEVNANFVIARSNSFPDESDCSFNPDVTPESLVYSVSEELTEMGLEVRPVHVSGDSVVFNVSGKPDSTAKKIYISDCVQLHWSNFRNMSENSTASGYIKPNYNPNAFIKITGKEYGVPGQEIEYSASSDVIIYARDSAGAQADNIYINLTKQKLVSDISYKCYSVDGGTKWKAVTSNLTDDQFPKLLVKGMTLSISDSYDKATKGPATDAHVYSFEPIAKAPAAPKFKIDYRTFADDTAANTGEFTLIDRDGNVIPSEKIRSDYEIAMADSLETKGWGIWPEEGGLTIAALGADGKPQKTIYYIRKKATATSTSISPASKYTKISVAGQLKAPKFKIDYKKEIIKGKEGLGVRCNEIYLAKNLTKDDAKGAMKEIAISSYLLVKTHSKFEIWQCATAKKPASAIQVIDAAERAEVPGDGAFTLSSGKLTLNKSYEAYNSEKGKWGSLPKITGSCEVKIRLKATAKGGKESENTFAASNAVTLKITYGEYDAEKGKSGVTAAEIVVK